jgi:hypothetical protein
MCNICRENERNWNFLKSKGYNSIKNGSIISKRILDLDILIINLYTKFHFSMCNHSEENGRKLQIVRIFLSPKGITVKKWLDRTQQRTWPRFSYNKSVYQISFQYVQPERRKWMETTNYWNFSKSKGHDSVKNGSIVPKTKLDLDIFMMNLYTKFHCSMCNQWEENERKLLMDRQTDSS